MNLEILPYFRVFSRAHTHTHTHTHARILRESLCHLSILRTQMFRQFGCLRRRHVEDELQVVAVAFVHSTCLLREKNGVIEQ